jgi:hypothetical protein
MMMMMMMRQCAKPIILLPTQQQPRGPSLRDVTNMMYIYRPEVVVQGIKPKENREKTNRSKKTKRLSRLFLFLGHDPGPNPNSHRSFAPNGR